MVKVLQPDTTNSNNLNCLDPIGVFDSGIGGLVVVKEIINKFPNSNLIYFGDLAHTPWGNKSDKTICNYALKITEFLFQQGCKTIVIACNSASAVAVDYLRDKKGDKVKILDVIQPVVSYIKKNYCDSNIDIGLIGTKQTIKSKIYNKYFISNKIYNTLHSLATPLLVPLIEEGIVGNKISDDILKYYLDNPYFEKIKALILGCTHYPLISDDIINFFNRDIDLISSATVVVDYLSDILKDNNLSSVDLLKTNIKPTRNFFVSEPADFFRELLARMLPGGYNLECFPLWD